MKHMRMYIVLAAIAMITPYAALNAQTPTPAKNVRGDTLTATYVLKVRGSTVNVLKTNTFTAGQPVFAGGLDSLYTPSAPVEEFFTFGFGVGNSTDTVAVSDSSDYGSFYNFTDTLQVMFVRAVMMHGIGVDTLTIQIAWDDSLHGSGAVNLNTTALPINSIGVGVLDAAFDNAKIPPGRWVWCKSPGVVAGRKPTALRVELAGVRIKVQ